MLLWLLRRLRLEDHLLRLLLLDTVLVHHRRRRQAERSHAATYIASHTNVCYISFIHVSCEGTSRTVAAGAQLMKPPSNFLNITHTSHVHVLFVTLVRCKIKSNQLQPSYLSIFLKQHNFLIILIVISPTSVMSTRRSSHLKSTKNLQKTNRHVDRLMTSLVKHIVNVKYT